jgi:hypothetical protein
MKRSLLLSVAFLMACSPDPKTSRVASLAVPVPAGPTRLPVALVGQWVAVAPYSVSGDSLSLRPDSSAQGIIPWPPNRLARISRWKVQFGSRDPVGTREDWKQGHRDGGDPECSFGNDPGCVSLPMLCLGALKQYLCEAFQYSAPDTLTLRSGLRYVRTRVSAQR